MEHGFTIEKRPEGKEILNLSMNVGISKASLSGKNIVFKNPAGRKLNYGKLKVFDAKGSEVVSTLEVPGADLIRIRIEDTNAIYPLTIDPLLTSTDDGMLESDQTYAAMGDKESQAPAM